MLSLLEGGPCPKPEVFGICTNCCSAYCDLYALVQHTSASLTINENYDSDVRDDTEIFLNVVVPEDILLKNLKASLIGFLAKAYAHGGGVSPVMSSIHVIQLKRRSH